MWKFSIVCAVLAAGCGGGDDCERFFDKMKPVMQEMAKERGKDRPITDADKAKFLEKCRASKKEAKPEELAMMKCVLDASGNDAVKACMSSAFGEFGKKSKATEAELQLNKISKGAKITFMETSAFPIGSAPLTPATACCGGPANKCASNPADWTGNPMWTALDFQMDEPHYFRYSVESDGKKLTAKAVGDLDCDSTEVTYTLEMTSEDGNPKSNVIKPANPD